MASKGDLYLNNASVIDIYDVIKAYETTVTDAFYSQYKNSFKISKSNYFRGEAADSFKSYMTDGTINIISGCMDLASDLSMLSQLIAETFFGYEKTHYGCVEEGALDYINDSLKNRKAIFEQSEAELNSVVNKAAQYISTTDLNMKSVYSGYSVMDKGIKKIRDDLYSTDDSLVTAIEDLYTRINDVNALITNIKNYCYTDDGKIIGDNVKSISSQPWFKNAGNLTLCLMLEEDPFKYAAGEVTLSEDQWAAGLCSDVYAYAGYKFLTAEGEAGIEDGTAFAKGKAAVLRVNGYAQFTDYLKAQAEVDLLFAEGEVKAGFSEDYVGFKVEGEVGVAKAEGSVVLGSDELNAFIKGEAEFLCADGKVAFEFEKDGQYAIGVDASATLASASVKGGTTILGYKDKDLATGETKTLMGFKVGAKATAGGSFAVWSESETAIETDYVNVNATTVKIDAAAALGLDLTVTVPTLYFKCPW